MLNPFPLIIPTHHVTVKNLSDTTKLTLKFLIPRPCLATGRIKAVPPKDNYPFVAERRLFEARKNLDLFRLCYKLVHLHFKGN